MSLSLYLSVVGETGENTSVVALIYFSIHGQREGDTRRFTPAVLPDLDVQRLGQKRSLDLV